MEEIRVNIAEDPRFQKYADNASEWASENTFHELGSMDAGDVANLLEQVLIRGGVKISKGSPEFRKRWFPRSEVPEITPELVMRTAEALKKGELEAAQFFIQDPMQWAWEEAYLPNDGDVRAAMEETIKDVDFPYDHSDLFDEFFDSEGYKKESELAETLAANVKLVHESGHYDRWLVFSWEGALGAVEAFLRFHGRKWKAARKALDSLMPRFVRNYMEAFFRNLDEEVSNIDAERRVHFGSKFREHLKDESAVKGVVDELIAWWKSGAVR